VDERHAGALLHDADIGMQVHAAGADALHVLRQADHAVAIRALQVGFGHQRRDRARIRRGHAHRLERERDEIAQVAEVDPDRRVQSASSIQVSWIASSTFSPARFGSSSNPSNASTQL